MVIVIQEHNVVDFNVVQDLYAVLTRVIRYVVTPMGSAHKKEINVVVHIVQLENNVVILDQINVLIMACVHLNVELVGVMEVNIAVTLKIVNVLQEAVVIQEHNVDQQPVQVVNTVVILDQVDVL